MADSSRDLLNRRVFCLITGASRGLGRCIAEKFAGKFGAGSCLLLIARNLTDLEAVKAEIEKASPKINVVVLSTDLSNPDLNDFTASILSVLEKVNVKPENFDKTVIIHNAGSLGDISKKSLDIEDADKIRKYFDLNITSPLVLNTAFFKIFPNEKLSSLVINISSLAAIQPYKTWVYYCTGKAARDMAFKVLAEEYPNLRVLSYSPGPLKTDMTIRAREETADLEVRQWFIDAYANDKMLTVDFTVDRLISILEKNEFKSGDHVDVFEGDSNTTHSRPS